MISGKIYCLKSFQTDKIYIGSTSQKIKRRLQQHKSHYKRYLNGEMNYLSSFEILQYDDCYIELIREVACEKKQLLNLEGQEINNNSKCVNLFLCGKSSNDYRKQCMKNYNQTEKRKEYIKNYNKDYQKTENFKQYRNRRTTCECGIEYNIISKYKHIKTQKHKNYLSSLLQ